MSGFKIGSKVPDFHFECTDPAIHSFKDLAGKNIVLYFYPKDNTPGCTLEGKEFKILHEEFKKLNTVILGVSRDPISSHTKFCDKLGLSFPLIADEKGELCTYFDVSIKNWLLRKIMSVSRTTFYIDQQGVVKQEWRNVRARGHANEVLEYAKLNSLY
ncbi:MAG: peroxiredoxin [Proteobacteria bacterium]|nr:peroxiredoxin [Pseudomonadota bacterium]